MVWGSKHIFLRGEDRISLSSYRFQTVEQPASNYNGNNSFLYTHVEENSGKGIMEGQLSTNAAPEEVKTILLKQVLGVKWREGGCGKRGICSIFLQG